MGKTYDKTDHEKLIEKEITRLELRLNECKTDTLTMFNNNQKVIFKYIFERGIINGIRLCKKTIINIKKKKAKKKKSIKK